jgi:hypothetical protein
MAGSNISYPHPVLGNGDDVDVGRLTPEVKYEISDEVIHLHADNLTTGHPNIDQMLQSGDASWHVRVQCARTYMRETFMVDRPTWSVRLKGDDYEGKVDVDIVIVAKSDTDDYRPKGLHEDYGDEKFMLRHGEVLAVGPTFSFLVDKVYDPLKAPVASLIRVDEGEHEDGPFTLTLDDDLIVVWLSKTDWREYDGICSRAPSIIHGAIVLPVLAEAIRRVDEHLDTLWGARLKDLLDRKSIDIGNPLTAAQEVLASPVTRMFGEVNATLDSGDL